ncbi:MAG: type VI secretion protein [Rhodobacteraceae bacterium]|nr:type VI secretion protein [Paracoccaceae bacterium]
MTLPSARVTDNVVCPAWSGPVPHVGGPIIPPCAPTVLVCYLPAARISDMNFCAGGPGVVATGSPAVLIMGMPAARLTDLAGHGGVIVGPGAPTVLIGGPAPPAPPPPPPPPELPEE